MVLLCRVSNHEKKLEAVRSGVRAISVSGKMEVISDMLSVDFRGCHLPWFPLLSLFLSSYLFTYLCTASHSSLSVRTVSPSLFNHSSCCLSQSASLASPSLLRLIQSVFFPLQTGHLFCLTCCRTSDISASYTNQGTAFPPLLCLLFRFTTKCYLNAQ